MARTFGRALSMSAASSRPARPRDDPSSPRVIPPIYVFDPQGIYADPHIQQWVAYYAAGGKDKAGARYFVSVPGLDDEEKVDDEENVGADVITQSPVPAPLTPPPSRNNTLKLSRRRTTSNVPKSPRFGFPSLGSEDSSPSTATKTESANLTAADGPGIFRRISKSKSKKGVLGLLEFLHITKRSNSKTPSPSPSFSIDSESPISPSVPTRFLPPFDDGDVLLSDLGEDDGEANETVSRLDPTEVHVTPYPNDEEVSDRSSRYGVANEKRALLPEHTHDCEEDEPAVPYNILEELSFPVTEDTPEKDKLKEDPQHPPTYDEIINAVEYQRAVDASVVSARREGQLDGLLAVRNGSDLSLAANIAARPLPPIPSTSRIEVELPPFVQSRSPSPGLSASWGNPNTESRMIYGNLFSLLLVEVTATARENTTSLWPILQDYSLTLRMSGSVLALVRSHKCRANLLQIASILELADDPRVIRALQQDEADIADILHSVSMSDDGRQEVLALEGDQAQCFLDVVQDVLDRGFLLDREDGTKARRLLVKLSENCDKLPSTLFIKGVDRPDQQASFGGGFGDVFRAAYKGRVVALKRMRIFQRDPAASSVRRRFCREALVWQHLRSPYIVPFLGIDADTFPSHLCLVSPWMRHGTILKYLNENGRTSVNKRLHEVTLGLSYLHSQNIVHGDLRGSNILINDNWQACLTDFGLTVFHDATAATHTSRREGSVRWMAPELFLPQNFGQDRFRLTPETDIYAFGCVCLELYTGRPPFANINPDPAVMLKVVKGERPSRPNEGSPLPNQLWAAMQRCWSARLNARPKITELVDIMEELSHYTVLINDVDTTEPEPTIVLPAPLAGPMSFDDSPTVTLSSSHRSSVTPTSSPRANNVEFSSSSSLSLSRNSTMKIHQRSASGLSSASLRDRQEARPLLSDTSPHLDLNVMGPRPMIKSSSSADCQVTTNTELASDLNLQLDVVFNTNFTLKEFDTPAAVMPEVAPPKSSWNRNILVLSMTPFVFYLVVYLFSLKVEANGVQ